MGSSHSLNLKKRAFDWSNWGASLRSRAERLSVLERGPAFGDCVTLPFSIFSGDVEFVG